MTRLLLSLFILLSVAPILPATTPVNPMTRLNLRTPHRQSLRQALPACEEEEPEQNPYQPMMLEISDPDVAADLEAMGVIIFNHRDNLLLTAIPREVLTEVLELDGIINAAASGDLSCELDLARPMGRVNAVLEALDGLPEGIDGSGIIVGFSDTGFDARHIAFQGRIGAFYDYYAARAERRSATTPDQIAAWVTDNADEFHATHVANILAGGYRGNSFYGVAPGAEIVATTSRLTDVGILAGVEDIIAYAKERHKTPIVNLSLANYLGPHDGTDLLCRYLSACAGDAIICISAGNSAKSNGYATALLSADAPEARVRLNSALTWNGYEVYGYTDIWGEDSRPLSVRIEVYDDNTRSIVWTSPWLQSDGAEAASLTVNPETFPEWGIYMSGEVVIEASLSSLNGRYNAAVAYDTATEPTSAGGAWSRYYTVIAVRYEQSEGQRVQLFADATYSYFQSAGNANTSICPQGTINDMCTASGVIAVGNCNSRNSAPLLGQEQPKVWAFEVGTVADHSSFSAPPALIEPLPHFCAPGNKVISALSTPYLLTHPDCRRSIEATVDGEDYYWFPEGGTSMSSPFTAGVFALWMQANPDLDAASALEIARATARTPEFDPANPQWGAGIIDAAAGLRKILADVSTPPILLPSGAAIPIAVYDPQGRRIATAGPHIPGLYITIYSDGSARKTLVR